MPKRSKYDMRSCETQRESRERFLRCLQGDVAWWRENADAIPDQATKRTALQIAASIESLFDVVRANWESD